MQPYLAVCPVVNPALSDDPGRGIFLAGDPKSPNESIVFF